MCHSMGNTMSTSHTVQDRSHVCHSPTPETPFICHIQYGIGVMSAKPETPLLCHTVWNRSPVCCSPTPETPLVSQMVYNGELHLPLVHAWNITPTWKINTYYIIMEWDRATSGPLNTMWDESSHAVQDRELCLPLTAPVYLTCQMCLPHLKHHSQVMLYDIGTHVCYSLHLKYHSQVM